MKRLIIIVTTIILSIVLITIPIVINEGRGNHYQTIKRQTITISKPIENSESLPKQIQKEIEAPSGSPVAPTTLTEETVQPDILSIQELGEKYLDLSTTEYQECFDMLINAYPDRFVESVREDNIKALRVWGSTCSTGIWRGCVPNYLNCAIGRYGDNGAFFDSDMAEYGRNM